MGVVRDALDYTWAVGQSDRIRECDNCIGTGNSKAVQLTRKEDGFLWHCFRCSLSGFFPDDNASPQQAEQLTEAMKTNKKMDNRPEVVELPAYHDKMLPQAAVDLYNCFFEPEDIEWFNIGWNVEHKRIIFPVYKYGKYSQKWARKLVGWTGKKLSTDDNPDKPKWHTVRQRDIKHPRFVAPPKYGITDKRVVLVEDVISAIRISMLGVTGIGLMTTYLPYELYNVLRGWEVKIWLDLDAFDKACKYQTKLGTNGISSDTIMTKKDPKDLSPEEIEEELKWQT